MIRAAALAACLAPAAAGAVPLALPIDCVPGETCHVQQYADRDPGPGARDFTCGPLSYEGHKGTDFALATDADIARDVAVLAAAPGVVTALRDGMPDIRQGTEGAPDVTGRDCGNGVVIDHGDGWETQYCHLKAGSVAVREGQRVAAGDRLGAVGLSGRTEFAHLHLSVRRDGAVVDPFDPSETATCGAGAAPLWIDPLPYTPGALLEIGWSNGIPDYEDVRAGRVADRAPAARDGALVIWAYAWGGRACDVLRLSWTGPEGETFDGEAALDRGQARFFRAAGRRAPAEGWPAGSYAGRVEWLRDGAVIDSAETTLTLD